MNRLRPRHLAALTLFAALVGAACSPEPPPEEAGRADVPAETAPGGRRDAPPSSAPASLTTGVGARLAYAQGETGEVDFGAVIEGFRHAHVYRLRTGGDQPTRITRVSTTCKCTRARLYVPGPDGERREYVLEEPIEPDTEVEVEVTVSSHERPGRWHSRIDLFSNDPARRLRLSTQGETRPIFTCEPGLNLTEGKHVRGDRIEGVVRFSTTHLEPFQVHVAEEETADELDVTLVPVGVAAGQPSRAWDVHYALGPLEERGFHSYPLQVETDVRVPLPKFPAQKRKYAVLFHVTVEVTDPVTAEPALLSFGRLDARAPAELEARVQANDDFRWSEPPAVRVALRKGPEGLAAALAAAVELRQEGRALAVRLTLVPPAEPAPPLAGSFAGTLTLELGHPEQERLTLRFNGGFAPPG